MDSTVIWRLWLLLSIFVILADGAIGHYYSYNPKSSYTKPPKIAPFDRNVSPPPRAGYFAGTYDALSKPLQWRKKSNLITLSNYHNSKPHNLTVTSPIPPVDEPSEKNPTTPPSNDIHPPAVIPPGYTSNNGPAFGGKSKPSLGVNGFSQAQQREPTAVDFGFLPVFPWPDKIPKKVGHLFPKSGNNEFGWRVPQVDNKLSHFPHPVRFTKQPTTTTISPSSSTQNNDHVWNPQMLTDLPTFPTLISSSNQDFQLEFETSTTPLPTTTTTSTTPVVTTTTQASSTKLASNAKNGRNSRTIRTYSWSQAPRRTKKPHFVLKEEKKHFSPRPGKSDFKRLQGPLVQSSLKQYTPTKCRSLNPFSDAIPHPHTDPSCQQGFPGWEKDSSCRCRFLVASRNFVGCATKFHTLCWRE